MTRTILSDRRGNVIGSTAILRDITEQLRTEEELHQARQLAMVGEMAATVAHQVKNPLAGIYAAIQYLSRGLEEGEEDYGQAARYLGTIPGCHHHFRLDAENPFEAGRTVRIGGNTARILRTSRLAPHFQVVGDDAVHFGPFGR